MNTNLSSKKQIFFTSILFIISIIIFLISFFVMKFTSSSPWDGTIFDISKVNFLDRNLANPYNHFLHIIGTITCGISYIFLPICFIAYTVHKSKNKKWTFLTLILIFCTTCLFNKGFYDLLKALVERIRPYMYFKNPAQKGILSGDFQHSWPSGHTANAFMGISFITINLIFSKDKSLWEKLFILSGYIFSISTGICRILSGNHYFTDVLSGAFLGSLVGFGISFLNKKFGMKIS